MKLIRSLMGRRQFLIGSVASASALAFTNIFRGKSIALTSGRSETGAPEGVNNRYSHLLSPLRIRDVVLKNRILYTIARPHFLQGPETYPTDAIRSYYLDIARNAAIVFVRNSVGNQPRQKQMAEDSKRMSIWDGDDPSVQNYIDQMLEGVHCVGSLVVTDIEGFGSQDVRISLEDAITNAKLIEDNRTADAVFVGARIRNLNRELLSEAIEQMRAVRESTNLLIMACIMDEKGGAFTVEEVVAMAKMIEGSADIMCLRTGTGNSYTQKEGSEPLALRYAQAIKESGIKTILCCCTNFRDPALNEKYIASGKTDMIGMARPFICDPDYVKKLEDGRGEDVIPCLMCNKCHGLHRLLGPWYSICSSNPKFGLPQAVESIKPPSRSKKVAVIGGGPAGIEAAITAAERGHSVTLYEKSDSLGGLLRHADNTPFKWTYREFKDYLIRKIYKAGVEVLLRTEATPKMIQERKYNAVLVAVGAEPIIPKIPGADGKNVWNVVNAYTNEKSMGKNVVIVGGGDFGTQTGMFLANAGHKVTVVTSDKELMQRTGPHVNDMQIAMYQTMDNFSSITEVTTTSISDGRITYKDAKGSENSIQADSVVIYAGLRPRMDEAMEFSDSAKDAFYIVGDCTGRCGTVQKSIRSAFFTASLV